MLGWTAAGLAALFVVLTIAVQVGVTIGADLALTRLVQSVNWSPLQIAFSFTDQWDGPRQVVLALLAILFIFVLNRRLAMAALLSTGSDAAWWVTELLTARPRPDPHLVHVVRHASGGSYPSGHVVFYLWALALLAASLSARLPVRLRPLPWLLATIVLAVICIGRIDYGEHWPSDVAGGLALGGAWVLAVIAAMAAFRRRGWPSFGPIARMRTSARPGRGSQARGA